jgi:hypothetical protein
VPVHIEELTTDMAVLQGDLPLSDRQIQAIVALVVAHLDQRERDERGRRAARSLQCDSVVPRPGDGG